MLDLIRNPRHDDMWHFLADCQQFARWHVEGWFNKPLMRPCVGLKVWPSLVSLYELIIMVLPPVSCIDAMAMMLAWFMLTTSLMSRMCVWQEPGIQPYIEFMSRQFALGILTNSRHERPLVTICYPNRCEFRLTRLDDVIIVVRNGKKISNDWEVHSIQ